MAPAQFWRGVDGGERHAGEHGGAATRPSARGSMGGCAMRVRAAACAAGAMSAAGSLATIGGVVAARRLRWRGPRGARGRVQEARFGTREPARGEFGNRDPRSRSRRAARCRRSVARSRPPWRRRRPRRRPCGPGLGSAKAAGAEPLERPRSRAASAYDPRGAPPARPPRSSRKPRCASTCSAQISARAPIPRSRSRRCSRCSRTAPSRTSSCCFAGRIAASRSPRPKFPAKPSAPAAAAREPWWRSRDA